MWKIESMALSKASSFARVNDVKQADLHKQRIEDTYTYTYTYRYIYAMRSCKYASHKMKQQQQGWLEADVDRKYRRFLLSSVLLVLFRLMVKFGPGDDDPSRLNQGTELTPIAQEKI